MKRIVCDTETDSLQANKIHLIVCEDVDSNDQWIFRPSRDPGDLQRFIELCQSLGRVQWIGHNFLSFDAPVLTRFTGICFPTDRITDTLILARFIRAGLENSLEWWGNRLGFPKLVFKDFSEGWSLEMEEYGIRDVKITKELFLYLENKLKVFPLEAIRMEHEHQALMNRQFHEGFVIKRKRAEKLLRGFQKRLREADAVIAKDLLAFPKLLRLVHPKVRKDGGINLISLGNAVELFEFLEPDAPFSYIQWEEFNPASHKQKIERLEPWWNPIVRTKGATLALRDRETPAHKRSHFERYGWKVNEENLSTVSPDAPRGIRLLRDRAIYKARIDKLTELLNATGDDGRVHGRVTSLGATSHRAMHDKPNMANLPGPQSKYGPMLRAILGTRDPLSYPLLGVDAAGIQYRIFAHLTGDKEFIHKVAHGKKEDGTDVHTYNWKLLQPVAKSRAVTKNLLFGYIIAYPRIGIPKVMELLECSRDEAQWVLKTIENEWPSIMDTKMRLAHEVEKTGIIRAVDGRYIKVMNKTGKKDVSRVMSTHLQSGEAIIMKYAQSRLWVPQATELGLDFALCSFTHDEWQTEVHRDHLNKMIELQMKSVEQAGQDLGLLCPLEGEYVIGRNWKETH